MGLVAASREALDTTAFCNPVDRRWVLALPFLSLVSLGSGPDEIEKTGLWTLKENPRDWVVGKR